LRECPLLKQLVHREALFASSKRFVATLLCLISWRFYHAGYSNVLCVMKNVCLRYFKIYRHNLRLEIYVDLNETCLQPIGETNSTSRPRNVPVPGVFLRGLIVNIVVVFVAGVRSTHRRVPTMTGALVELFFYPWSVRLIAIWLCLEEIYK
jgi:hypothetical protein